MDKPDNETNHLITLHFLLKKTVINGYIGSFSEIYSFKLQHAMFMA